MKIVKVFLSSLSIQIRAIVKYLNKAEKLLHLYYNKIKAEYIVLEKNHNFKIM